MKSYSLQPVHAPAPDDPWRPYKRLATAVLLRAVADKTELTPEGRRGLELWARWLDIELRDLQTLQASRRAS